MAVYGAVPPPPPKKNISEEWSSHIGHMKKINVYKIHYLKKNYPPVTPPLKKKVPSIFFSIWIDYSNIKMSKI